MNKNILSFEDACKALNIEAVLPDFTILPEKHRTALTAHYKLVIIAQALNDGWEPDWTNYDEYKYYPWFVVEEKSSGPGLGLSYIVYAYAGSFADVGSRLCYRTRELARYAGTQFKDLYEEYFLIK